MGPNIVPPNARLFSRGHNPRSQCNLLADPEYTSNVLVEAGWSAIERTTYRQTVIVEREALLDDDAYLDYYGVGKDRLAEARVACERHLAPLRRSDGRYNAPLAFQIFTARN